MRSGIGNALDLQREENNPLKWIKCQFCKAEWVERRDSQTSPSGDGMGIRTTTYSQVVEGTPCDCAAKRAARLAAEERARQDAADAAEAAERLAAFLALPPVAPGTLAYIGAEAHVVPVGEGCRLGKREGRPAVLAIPPDRTFARLVGFPSPDDAIWYAS